MFVIAIVHLLAITRSLHYNLHMTDYTTKLLVRLTKSMGRRVQEISWMEPRGMREMCLVQRRENMYDNDDDNCDKDEASYWTDEVLSGMHNVNGRIHACGGLFGVMMTWFE